MLLTLRFRVSFRLSAAPTKQFSGHDEAGLKQESALMHVDQPMGCGHGGTDHQLGLSRAVQEVFDCHSSSAALGIRSIVEAKSRPSPHPICWRLPRCNGVALADVATSDGDRARL